MKKTVLRMIAIFMLVISTSLWLPYDNAQALTRQPSEGPNTQTDSVSKDDSIIYKLNEFKPPTGFSGVYNIETKDLEVKPSVYVPKKLWVSNVTKENGYKLADSVKSNGGHLEIENELIIKDLVKDKTIKEKVAQLQENNVGFFFCLEEGEKGKVLNFNWISRQINERNNSDKCAPEKLRGEIRRVIEEKVNKNKQENEKYIVEGSTCGSEKVESQCLKNNGDIDRLFVAAQAVPQ